MISPPNKSTGDSAGVGSTDYDVNCHFLGFLLSTIESLSELLSQLFNRLGQIFSPGQRSRKYLSPYILEMAFSTSCVPPFVTRQSAEWSLAQGPSANLN